MKQIFLKEADVLEIVNSGAAVPLRFTVHYVKRRTSGSLILDSVLATITPDSVATILGPVTAGEVWIVKEITLVNASEVEDFNGRLVQKRNQVRYELASVSAASQLNNTWILSEAAN